MVARSGWLIVISLHLLSAVAMAQVSYPMVARVQPAALQRGQTVEATIGGTQNFAGASALLFEGAGLSGEVVADPAKPADAKKPVNTIKARITATADAALGPREFRVVTPQGVSSTAVLLIVADPVVVEADDKANDTQANAQKAAVPGAWTGSIGKAEDVDWYAFDVQAGQTLTFSVWGNRLENVIHDLQAHLDPILQLHDASGRELAADDNRDYADPLLIHRFEQAGTYYLQVRDTTYAGNANWSYVVMVSAGPYARSVFPMAVRPGACNLLKSVGPGIDPAESITLCLASDVPPGLRLFPIETAAGETPPVPLLVTNLPTAVEEGDAAEAVSEAPTIALPIALNGRLDKTGDIDTYRFETKKGVVHGFEVVARRALSQADPVLRIVDAQGKQLAEADDTFGKDPRLEWTAPADGVFALMVRDLHGRGGDDSGYVLLAESAAPDYLLTCDPDKLNLGPGARTPLFVKVERRGGFVGPVSVAFDDLPAGVSASPLTIGPKMTQGEIVVSASAEAVLGGRFVALTGRGQAPDGSAIVRKAQPRQEIYLPGGGRGLYNVSTLVMGITQPSEITLEASTDPIVLTPGGAATIEVTVNRREGMDKPVNLAVSLGHLGSVFASGLPPGVVFKEAGSKTLLAPGESKGRIVLEAKPDAPPSDPVPIAVMGHVSINFVVKTAYCTAPISLSVAPKP